MAPVPDEPRDLELLLARAARVRALARALCADVTGAEDLAQDALVVSLERPGSEAAPLAWFRRVLERLALDRGRAEAARRGRERRAARPEAQPGTFDLVARADLQRRLVEAVLALSEPYREVLLERWFEERTPQEIARRLGIPASTVRTRLARAQALLRERLAKREGREWLGALMALGRGRGEDAAGPWTTIGTGGVLVTTGTKLALMASALAAGALWFAWPERGAAPPASLQPTVASAAPGSESPVDEERELQLRSEVAALDVAAPEATPAVAAALPEELSEAEAAALELADGVVEPGILRGLVLRGRTPIAGGTAWLATGLRYSPRDPLQPWPGLYNPVPVPDGDEPRSTPIGPDGRFQFEQVRGGFQSLAIDGGQGVERLMTFDTRRGERSWRTVVVVLGSASIAGHVYDELGAPVVGARVKTFQNLRRNEHMRGFVGSTTTDSAGAYALRDLPAGHWPVWLHRDGSVHIPDEVMQVDLDLGQQATLDFGRAWPQPAWSGTLRARSGDPVHGVRLTLVETARDWRREVLVVDGTFRIPLAPGTYRVTTPVTSSMLEHVELATVEIGEIGLERDLELPGTHLRGLALDAANGAPWSRDGEQSIAIRPRGHDYSAAITSGQVAPDGTFVFDGLWAGEWVLGGHPFDTRALGGGEAAITIHEGQVDADLTVNLVLP